jgi:Pyruvate/2-oxoacid:ferredoxin oxidoreductase gamma subunit
MVRSGSPADRLAPKVRPAATILFAGPMGTGVGIAADIAADVARLSQRTVTRRRDFTSAAATIGPHISHAKPTPIVLQVVSFGDAEHTAGAGRIDIAIAWDHASAAALKAAGLDIVETIVIDRESLEAGEVPTWRRDLITDAADADSANASRSKARGLQRTARALKTLSVRVPFTRELWERVLKLHVPARRRRAAASEFSK